MDKKQSRLRRCRKNRFKLKELERYRLCVSRTPRHTYAQVISPDGGHVVASASTVEKSLRDQLSYTGNKTAAELIGKTIAERALAAGVDVVAFDRSGFKYHGRVETLANAAREAGLRF